MTGTRRSSRLTMLGNRAERVGRGRYPERISIAGGVL